MPTPVFSGKLSEHPLPVVLGRLLARGRSGVLKLSRAAMTRQLFVENGVVIRYAASNLMTESLSEHLKRLGRFQPEQMRRATSEKQPRELLSTTLLRLGFVTAEEHHEMVREMIEKIVVAAAEWRDAAYEFHDGELPFTQPGDAGLVVSLAILGLVRHGKDPAVVRHALGRPETRLRVNPAPPMPLERIPLDTGEGFLISRADGSLTLAEIASTSPLGPEETERALCGLILAGILLREGASEEARESDPAPPRSTQRAASPGPASAPAPSRPRTPGPVDEMLRRFAELRGQDLYQVLGIGTGASESEIRHAYYGMAKRLHPDKFPDEELKAKAEKLFAAITEAYTTLSRPENRKEYDGTRAQQEKPSAESTAAASAEVARQNFLRGRAHYEKGEMVKALPFFEHAVEQDGSKEEYRRLLGLVQSRNPRLRREAEQSFLAAIQLNPTVAENYAQLGLIYRKIGQEQKALEYFQQALSWDPSHPVAQEAVSATGESRKGLFRGLFGKQ
jgi:curved DNA-binding protein CbpA